MSKRAVAVLNPPRGRERVRRKSSLKKRIKTGIILGFISVLAAASVGILYLLFLFVKVTKTLPSIAAIGNMHSYGPTRLYFSDGTVMAVLASENRHQVKLTEVSKYVTDATIATEDARFYEHHGVDYHGVARAIFRDVSARDAHKEGGSTITQQLARNVNELGLSRQKNLSRKMAEAVLAVRIEQTFNKEEILELYLNQIYYGSGAYGVEAGALTYFHHKSRNLTLAQAAMLAGMPQRPSYYSSPEHRDAAQKRRDQVLQRMYETGKITIGARDAAQAEPLKIFKSEPRPTRIYGAPHFVNYVMAQLISEFGTDAVYGGLQIHTTLDPRMQKAAEHALIEGIRRYGESANQGCLICLDPKTGYVRAMVGGVKYRRDQYNVTVQGKRQPGSAFKPIVYAAAFDTGACDLDSTYVDDDDLPEKTNDDWAPKNYGGRYSHRSMSVRTAIQFSVNTVAVKVAQETGLKTVIDYAHKLGITTEIKPYAPLALGTSAVHPIDLCSVYSVFANDGRKATPMGIIKIVGGNGDVISERLPQVEPTGLKQETIDQINDALRNVVQRGTGTYASRVPDACGKTGTTSDNRDAWFAGYTPDLVAVVWAAHENRDAHGQLNRKVAFAEMPGTTGGHLCAPIWRDFMLEAAPIQQEINKKLYGSTPKPPKEEQEVKPRKKRRKLEKVPGTEPQKQPSAENATPAIQKPASPDTGGPADQPAAPAAAPPLHEAAAPTSAPPVVAASSPSHSHDATREAVARQPKSPAPTRLRSPSAARSTERTGMLSVEDVPSRLTTTRLTDSGRRTAVQPSRPPSSARMSEPSAPPPRRADPGEEMVSARLCAESLRHATQWCDATIERRVRRKDIPSRCRKHHAPPGEEDR